MKRTEDGEQAALLKQFERFVQEKRAVEAFEVFEELARRKGGLQHVDSESVRVVLSIFAESDPGGGKNTWWKLLFLWCRERRWDDEYIARFFLDLVDELNEDGEEVPAAMDQLALSLEPSPRRWSEWAKWQLGDVSVDDNLSALSAEEMIARLKAEGWEYDFKEIAQHPGATTTLKQAVELEPDGALKGMLQFFLEWI